MQKGIVYRNAQLVGEIAKEGNAYTFTYFQEYLNDPRSRPISINLPLQKEPFISTVLFPFFANMLAEGSTKMIQCQALRIDENDLFTRLLKTTENNTIGSITVKEVVVPKDNT